MYTLSLYAKKMYFLWWMDLLEMWFHEISRVQRHTLQWQTLHTAYMHRIMGCQENIAQNTVFPKISSTALLSKLWSHEKSKRLRPRLWSPIAAHQSHGYARCHAVSLHKHSPWPWQALCRVPVLRKPSRKLRKHVRNMSHHKNSGRVEVLSPAWNINKRKKMWLWNPTLGVIL